MPGRNSSLAGVGMLLALASGCSSPDVTCSSGDSTGDHSDAPRVTSREIEREVILSADETSFSAKFEGVLDQLPEVWVGEEPLHLPSLELWFELEYTEPQPPEAQLPEIEVALEADQKSPSAQYWVEDSAVLGGSPSFGESVRVALFSVCEWGSTEECCPYGASRCSGGATLTLSREADVFPPVRVRYTAKATAGVYACLEDEPAATWTLEETESEQ